VAGRERAAADQIAGARSGVARAEFREAQRRAAQRILSRSLFDERAVFEHPDLEAGEVFQPVPEFPSLVRSGPALRSTSPRCNPNAATKSAG
jgi:hypothetical protein